ncbi:MAG: hypothetical protein LBD13_04910 [Spirochaetaceae bacterium]|jgi:hypothetical protein|nr:hypothetical protein [Spirochaetaceae bacterium]
MKISKKMFLSPAGLFVIYMVLSFLAVMGFRMLFPGEPAPLASHGKSWRLIQGVIAFITLFPALTMAGLVLPFGLKTQKCGEFDRFSEAFLDQVKPSVFAAIGAAACYGLLFFLVFPLVQSQETTLRSEGRLFTASKAKALASAEKGAWLEAAQFIAVCDQIWPDSPEIESLRADALMGIEAWRISQANAQMEAWVKGDMYQDMMAAYSRLEGKEQPVNAAAALALADKAMQAERYFDAHWLANLGEQLAGRGSQERRAGKELANHAWDAVTSLKPNTREQRAYDLYRKKREGYEAMMGENWIKAYYIFKELAVETPGDPDADRFLAISERGAKTKAFFIDEIELTLGEILSSALFSFPLELAEGNKKGRMVLRFGSLSTAPNFSYGIDLELMAFDASGTLLYQMQAPYVKIIPLEREGEGPRLICMFKALDRLDETKHHEPLWQGPAPPAVRNDMFAINLAYDDFLVLARLGWGLEPILIGDLMGMAKRIGAYGYIPELFQAEILNRFSEAAFFLPMSILIIVIGWRYRSKKISLQVGIPMLVVLPLIFNSVVFLCRSMLHSLSVWSVIFLKFSTAIAVFTIGTVVFLILTLILLAAQKA